MANIVNPLCPECYGDNVIYYIFDANYPNKYIMECLTCGHPIDIVERDITNEVIPAHEN